MIEKYQIEDIIQRANIVDVVRKYLFLKKAGNNYKAKCPFHPEKTPSFVVSEEKQIYHCFGCGDGGNVLSFLMKIENLNFIEAIKILAKEVGIELKENKKNSKEISDTYRIMELVNNYNINNLNQKREIYQYLLDRNITDDLIKEFKIGYGGEDVRNFNRYLKNNKIDLKTLLKLGIATSNSYNDFYYRFINRITFPIFDITGRVIAFGGRIIDDTKKTAKYVNSSDSIIFKKGNMLYNLNKAKKHLFDNDYFILSEGYIDVIILYKYGFKNSVACLGTSLTNEQANILSRYTKNIIVIYDADDAGQKAAERSIEILLNNNIIPKIVVLEENLDPAEFLIKFGADKLKEKINNAEYYLDYKLSRLLKEYDPNDINNKKIIMHQLFKYLITTDMIVRDTYFKKLSGSLFISEQIILLEYNNYLRLQRKNRYVKEPDKISKQQIIDKTALPDNYEIELIAVMIIKNQIIEYVKHCKNELTLSDNIMNIVEEAFNSERLSIGLIETDQKELLNKITEKMFELEKILKDDHDIAAYMKDIIKKVKKKSVEKKINLLTQKIRENQDNKERNFELTKEKNRLQKLLKVELI